MTPAQRLQVRQETMLGTCINAVLSLAAAWLTFGGRSIIAWCCSTSSLTFDALPHSFAVAFMATLVPSLIVLGRVRKGRVEGCPPPSFWPARIRTRILIRAALFGAAAGMTGAALHALAGFTVMPEWPIAVVLMFKAIYGAAVSLVATPLALGRLFASLDAGVSGSSP